MDSTRARRIIEEFLAKLGVSYSEVRDLSSGGSLSFLIRSDDSKALIGPGGETLRALNHLLKKIAGADDGAKLSIDVNGYLESRKQALKNKAFVYAERARSFKADVELPPMSSYERMVVHSFLADDPHLKTASAGEGRERHIVISYIP